VPLPACLGLVERGVLPSYARPPGVNPDTAIAPRVRARAASGFIPFTMSVKCRIDRLFRIGTKGCVHAWASHSNPFYIRPCSSNLHSFDDCRTFSGFRKVESEESNRALQKHQKRIDADALLLRNKSKTCSAEGTTYSIRKLATCANVKSFRRT